MLLLDTISETLGRIMNKGTSLLRDAPPSHYSQFRGATGIPPDAKAGEGLKVYQQNPWAYAATNAMVDILSTTELFLRKKKISKDGSVEYDIVREHQALELLSNPIPKDGALSGRSYLTETLLKKITWIHQIASGEAFWAVGGNVGAFGGFAGVPTELHPLMPNGVSVKLGKDNYVEAYIYEVGGKKFILDPKNVVHFKLPDPLNLYRGQSAYKSAGTAIDTDFESNKYLYHWFKNFARPDTVVIAEDEPKAEEKERIREQFRNKYEGGENCGRTMFLWNGIKIEDISKTQRDMQFKELKEFNRDEIMASLRIGKGMIGMMEDQSRANAEAQDYVFGKRVIKPMMIGWCEQLTYDFLPLFGGTENLEFWFDEASIMPDDQTTNATVFTQLWNIGAVSANEVRSKFNLTPRDEPDADKLWMPLAKTPAGDTEEGADFGDPGGEGDDGLGEPDFGDEPTEDDKEGREAKNDPIKITKAAQLFNDRKEIELFRKNAEKHLSLAMKAGIDLGVEQVGDAMTPKNLLNLPAAQAALKKLSLSHAVETLKATTADLQRIIDQALEEGRSNGELATAISRKYGKEYKGYRALRIARTETTGAVNAGTLQVFKAEDIEFKVWVATMDDRTRDTHMEAADETERNPVRIEDNFNVGGYSAAEPGDASLPPEERVNCRCTMVSADFLDVMKEKRYKEMFLRSHGSIEKKFAQSIRTQFEAQKARVLSRLNP